MSQSSEIVPDYFSEIDSLHTGLNPIPEDQVEDNTPQTQSVPVIEALATSNNLQSLIKQKRMKLSQIPLQREKKKEMIYPIFVYHNIQSGYTSTYVS